MNKKDLGLLALIVVVGFVVYLRNPAFLGPQNLANTANLIGLFGLFAIGQGFVIITGGIELSAGSMIALLGVLFVDLVGAKGVPWPIAFAIVMVLVIQHNDGDDDPDPTTTTTSSTTTTVARSTTTTDDTDTSGPPGT